MELSIINNNHIPISSSVPEVVSTPFIEANTVEMNLTEIRDNHIIPVFVKNNEPTISQVDFMNLVGDITERFYGFNLNEPEIRVSHPIKGRIPSARYKSATELLPHEKTLYYERCAFLYKIPSITRKVGKHKVQLTVGGIKAYNLDNLNRNGSAPQYFKLFVGFQVKVCCNLCIFTDGSKDNVKVSTQHQLKEQVTQLLQSFNGDQQLDVLNSLTNDGITDSTFATLVGRCRMYQHLPPEQKKVLLELLLSDSQINSVVKGYYHDEEFSNNGNGISYWGLYNLFTNAVKSSYIDNYVLKNCNSMNFVNELNDTKTTWFKQ